MSMISYIYAEELFFRWWLIEADGLGDGHMVIQSSQIVVMKRWAPAPHT